MDIDNLTVHFVFVGENKQTIPSYQLPSKSTKHLSSCYCYGYRVWGGLSLSRVLWKSAYSRSNMKPKSSKIYSKTGSEIYQEIVLLVSGASARLHVPFILHSFARIFLHVPFICMHFAFSFHFAFISFHVPFMCIHVLSYYNPFIFIPMCIHFLSYSFHLHACSFHFALISLHVLSFPCISFWNWLYGLARGPSATNGHR